MTSSESWDALAESMLGEPDVAESSMFGSPCLKTGRKVFASFHRDQFVLKLPAERVAALKEAGRGADFDPGMGRVMKEWVVIVAPASDWRELAVEARSFVALAGS